MLESWELAVSGLAQSCSLTMPLLRPCGADDWTDQPHEGESACAGWQLRRALHAVLYLSVCCAVCVCGALRRSLSTIITHDKNAGLLLCYQSGLTCAIGRYNVPCVQMGSCSIARICEQSVETYVQSMPGNDTLKMPRTEVTVRQVPSRQRSMEQCNNSFQEEVCQRNL